MHVFLTVLVVWTALWIIAQVFLHYSEYGQHITWLARIVLYVFPLFIIYNVIRHAVGAKTENEKIAEEYRGKV